MKHKLKLIKRNNTYGITLIALVLTIIVLLILAGVSIATLTGTNGIFTRVNDAKIETAIGAVKEALKLEQGEKVIDNKNLTPEILLSEGKVSRTVQQGEEEKYYMYYAIKENAYEGMQGLGKGNIASLKDVFLIDDNLNVKYIASNGKEYGDNLDNKVLEDETEIRFSSKAFSEYVSKISGVTEDEMKFKWMKNQTKLTISDPNVDSLQDLVFFPNLTYLSLGNYTNIPQITKMDGVENCTKLKEIYITKVPVTDYTAISKLSNLEVFNSNAYNDNRAYNNLIDALKFCNNLQTIRLLSYIIEGDMYRISELSNNLKSINFQSCNIAEIAGLEDKTNLTSLSLSDNNIEKIQGLENLKQLKSLILYNNKITDITPLAVNTELIELGLNGNVGIDGNRNNYIGERLEALNKIGGILDRNGNIYLDLKQLGLFTNYKSLNLKSQNLTTLEPLEGFTQLTSLNLGYNQITLEDEKSQEILKSMKHLKTLDLTANKVTNATAINSLKELTLLYVGGTFDLSQIEDIISNVRLVVSNETLKTIVNCNVNKITKLTMNSAGITELPDLSKFTKLENLNLRQNNDITDFSMISKIPSLKTLDLAYNTNLQGNMFDFSKLTNLTSLNLGECKLWSEDLEYLKALKNNKNLYINLGANSIIDALVLLELDDSCSIDLRNNINLLQKSKDKLKEKFGSKVYL